VVSLDDKVAQKRSSWCRALHLYPRINFKLSRTAALAEWRQLLLA